MASSKKGMANGTKKPDYMNSFMSFLEDSADPDDPVSLPQEEELVEELDIKSEIKEEDMGMGLDPPEDEITPTDHTPASFDVTDEENTNSSEATSMSEGGDASKASRRNVARRGKGKRGGANSSAVAPSRENLRRSSRTVKSFKHAEPESDGLADSDQDFHLSDSDDDPDFNPVDKKTSAASDDEEELPRRGRGRGRGTITHRGVFSPLGRGRGIKRSPEKDKSAATTSPANPPKRRGRPPSYQAVRALPTTENSEGNNSGTAQNSTTPTVERTGSSQLSSAYNYAGGRAQRQQNQIMLPEGPQLTAEQLEMVESQFKSGDFVMAKKDMDLMEHPPIWRIDGKSLLQKFQSFEKDGKILYRNISTYSGWTPQAKALYQGVRVTFVFQSRYDTVVQMVGFKPQGEEEDEGEEATAAGDSIQNGNSKQSWSAIKTPQHDFEISEELVSRKKNFEIYLQTLISQALDSNFMVEIYEDKDAYFVDNVKVIDDLAEQRKKNILEIIQWNDQFKRSLDVWPNVNVMLRTAKNAETCRACKTTPSIKLLQLYGQPYNQLSLHSREPLPSESEVKNYDVCDNCSNVSQLYNKVCHQKYDYYSQCKSKVTNMRVADPQKGTTTILQELLADDHWITKLFRSMCTTFIKVDRLHEDEIQRKGGEQTAAT